MMRSLTLVLQRLPLVVLLACQESTTPVSPPTEPVESFAAVVTDNVVASLTVIPDSQIVFVGDQFTVTAKPWNAAGQLLDRTVKWTVGSTSIAKALDSLKATMRFRALKIGTTSLKAQVDAKARLSKVVVRDVVGARVIVTPATASVVAGKTVRFVATGLTKAGEKASVQVTWTTNGGSVSGSGVLTAGTTAGKYRVIATARFGAADTSIVTITAALVPLASVVLVPATATVASGTSLAFAAYGRTSAGDSVAAAVTYTATGGAVSSAGGYTAGNTPGTFRVIARHASGLADTSQVTIPAAGVARLVLMPDVAASRGGETTRFEASALTATNQKVAATPVFQSSCGTVSGTGVVTAPVSGSNCVVTASYDGKADTTELVLLPNQPELGTPFGVYALWKSPVAIPSTGVAPLSASLGPVAPADVIRHLDAARTYGIRLILSLTGGSHELYKTDGVFDLSKWQATMDRYNTAAIRDAIERAVSDGTIIGNQVMDEPQQHDWSTGYREKSWGPKGTMTKARVDGLCSYVKAIFPTLPVGAIHDHRAFDPNSTYQICDFTVNQYDYIKGDITIYRDEAVAQAQREKMAIIFSMNILNGGKQDRDGVYDCAGTGGLGTYSPNCRVTSTQLREWGNLLAPAGCAMMMWRYDETFMAKSENVAAISDVAIRLAPLSRKRCTADRAPNTPPSAAFVASCTDLACSFTDGSTDPGGRVTGWSWSFGDGHTSTDQHPSHSYPVSGIYQVSLTVTDNGNAIGTLEKSVTVTAPSSPNTPPVAAFTFSCTNFDCSFTDASTDEDGSVASRAWEFGDGGTSTARDPAHTYAAAGSYEVTLSVEDDRGATRSITQSLTVTRPADNAPPLAAFSFDCTDLACSFQDESSDNGTLTDWSWDFGDGSLSSDRQPTHTYASDGTFEVSLVVTDDQGATARSTRTVTTVASIAEAGP